MEIQEQFVFKGENDGSTSLTIKKVAEIEDRGGLGLLTALEVADIPSAGSSFFDLGYNEIVITHIDENTTIYGGRNDNSFVPEEDVLFTGNIYGGQGFKPYLTADGVTGFLDRVDSFLGGDFEAIIPERVSNTLDVSGRSGTRESSSEKDYGDELFSPNFVNIGNTIINKFQNRESTDIRSSIYSFSDKSLGDDFLAGDVRYIQNVNYGKGLNTIIGNGFTSEPGAFDESISVLDRTFGSNVFSIGVNPISATLSPIANNGFTKEGLKDVAADNLFGDLGAHVIYGGTGADTYNFEGKWGATAIIETPDLVVSNQEGSALPEFFDTLDFSNVFSDHLFCLFLSRAPLHHPCRSVQPLPR